MFSSSGWDLCNTMCLLKRNCINALSGTIFWVPQKKGGCWLIQCFCLFCLFCQVIGEFLIVTFLKGDIKKVGLHTVFYVFSVTKEPWLVFLFGLCCRSQMICVCMLVKVANWSVAEAGDPSLGSPLLCGSLQCRLGVMLVRFILLFKLSLSQGLFFFFWYLFRGGNIK